MQPSHVDRPLADDAVIARRDQAAPPADLLDPRFGDRQPDLAEDGHAEHLVGDVFGVFAGLGLDHVRARGASLGPGPAPVLLVADEGQLVALARQDEAGALLAVRQRRRRSLHRFRERVLVEPDERLRLVRCAGPLRRAGN